MAVAEEVKILEEDEITVSSNISSGTNSQQPVQTTVDNVAVYDKSNAERTDLKQDVNKKQSGEGKDQEKANEVADLDGGTTLTGREEMDSNVVTAPAGYVGTTTVASKESSDEDKSKN